MRSAAARCWSAVTTFFRDLLKHRPIQEQLGDEPLEPLNLVLQLAATAFGADLLRVVPLPPTVGGRLGDSDLSAEVRDRQPLDQIAVRVAE